MVGRTKVIITDDKKGYRTIFRNLLKQHNIDTIGTAEHGLALINLLDTMVPDVILLDVDMPIMDGVTTMKQLQTKHPERKVIVLSQHNDNCLIVEFEKMGARGYVSKDEAMGDMEQFAKVIEKIKQGKKHIVKNPEQPTIKLSEIQKDIIHLNGKSMDKKEISEVLGITVDGVAKQEKKIMAKIGVTNIKALTSYIIKTGLAFLRGRQTK